VIWLCPVYQSPNDDNGYDIGDDQDIMHEFGTLADPEEMLAGMHQRGIKPVLDLVVNNTSDEHPLPGSVLVRKTPPKCHEPFQKHLCYDGNRAYQSRE
jgi:glycosidase